MKVKTQITISRVRSSRDGEFVRISLDDVNANVRVTDVRLSLEAFSLALFGQGYVDCETEVSAHLDRIGKKRLMETLEFPFDRASTSVRKVQDAAYEEALQHAPQGWTVDGHFGSQDSFFRKDGVPYARTRIMRWVDED